MMMKKLNRYLIDTNIYTNALKNNQHHQLRNFLKTLESNSFVVANFVLLELLTFYRNSPEAVKQDALNLIKELMNSEIIDFNYDDWSMALEVRTQFLKMGRTNRSLDPLIATLAITHDCILVTANKKDFIGIPNLKTKLYSQQFQRWE
jgi:predicted nucleic acid-binding protein